MPQTAASHEARVELMKNLAERFPNVAWKICVSQFGSHHEMGDYSHKPRWRPDGFGFGQPFPTWSPILKFQREMAELALNWKEHTLVELSDLVERLHALDDGYQTRVWTLIETWAKTKASDADKAAMREKVRVTALSRRAAMHAKKNARVAALASKAKMAYAALEPSDLMNKHAWLFRETLVEESADEIEDVEKSDFQKRDERIQKMRVDALREIHDHRGISALLEFAERGKASSLVGFYAARDLLSEAELVKLLRLAFQKVLEGGEVASPSKNVVAGAVRAMQDEDRRERVLKALAIEQSEADVVQLLMLAPFCKGTWKLVDALGEETQSKYWSSVAPDWIHDSDAENNKSVEYLLKADRPRAAFWCVRHDPEILDAQCSSGCCQRLWRAAMRSRANTCLNITTSNGHLSISTPAPY
jgi:hypothetical protein